MNFQNARIALLETRMSGELADLIRRAGGNTPVCVSAVQETPLNSASQVSTFIDRLTNGSIPIVVFFTGAGAKLLLTRPNDLTARLNSSQHCVLSLWFAEDLNPPVS